MSKYNKKINTFEMLEEIRKLLDLTIAQFCSEMDWPNHRYYDHLKSGRFVKDGTKVPSSPSVEKIFGGINHAIDNYDHWNKNKAEVTGIVVKYLIK